MKYRYPFTNAIVFALVMRDQSLCRELLQRIFPNRPIRDLRPHESFGNIEETLIVGPESKRVRLDVLFTDSDAWYDIEMQVRNEANIPKRSRYSHAIMDVDSLKPGQDYNELKQSYVIFLCSFDACGLGRPMYQFEMVDLGNDLKLGDETYTIILNAKADESLTPEPMRSLFRYMNEQTVSDDSLIRRIDESVENWNTGEGLRQIMTLEQEILIRENRKYKEGLEAGEQIGIEKGRKEGQIKMLISLVKDELITVRDAAQRAGVSEAAFLELMEQTEQTEQPEQSKK